jgi:hypothetical protein
MKTKIELEQDIISITGKIHKEFPELVKYITEIPIHISAEADGNTKNLEDYYFSLEQIIQTYSKTHKKT